MNANHQDRWNCIVVKIAELIMRDPLFAMVNYKDEDILERITKRECAAPNSLCITFGLQKANTYCKLNIVPIEESLVPEHSELFIRYSLNCDSYNSDMKLAITTANFVIQVSLLGIEIEQTVRMMQRYMS